MVITTLADGITRSLRAVSDTVSAPFSEPVIRLGVTGLSRAGKTVFITSLVANLLNRGRMPQFRAAATGAIQTAYLQPQPDDTIARFEYENHLAALTAPQPYWPEGTTRVSELRLSLRVQGSGLLGSFQGPRTVHLDIVDYPGEWLLDLALMDQDYASWSAQVLGRLAGRPMSEDVQSALAECDASAPYDQAQAQTLNPIFAFSTLMHRVRNLIKKRRISGSGYQS